MEKEYLDYEGTAEIVEKLTKELTRAEYDALSSAEKNNGTVYYITDEGGSAPSPSGSGAVAIHEAKNVYSENGIHGLRYYNGELQAINPISGDWETISSGGGESSVPNIQKALVIAGNQSTTLKWSDPNDNLWEGTKVVRKIGSAPHDPTDGTLVVDSKVKDAYAVNGYSDTGLTNGTTYYYGFFAYRTDSGTNVYASGVFDYSTPKVLSSFTTATDQELISLVTASENGTLDLYETEGWRVGDERVITLNSVGNTWSGLGDDYHVNESHVSQQVTLVLMHHGHTNYTTYKVVNGNRTAKNCAFIAGFKNCLLEEGFYNDSEQKENELFGSIREGGGYTWAVYCLYSTMIPSSIKDIFKKAVSIRQRSESSMVELDEGYFTFATEKEIFGNVLYQNSYDAARFEQFEYYQTELNRIKTLGDGGQNASWWTRTTLSTDVDQAVIVYANGGRGVIPKSSNAGLSLICFI